MEKWEYLTALLRADIDKKGVKEYLKEEYPAWSPPKRAIQTTEMALDAYGRQGWELVHMDGVFVSDDGDLHPNGFSVDRSYFCVFKRRIQE